MKTATVNEVREKWESVLRWVEHGETVEITRRKKMIARIVPTSTAPVASAPTKRVVWPDRLAELRAIYGDKPPRGKTGSEIISEAREDRF